MTFQKKENKRDTHYDLIVVGAGSGLRVASHAASVLGWKVAIVEEGPMGGTCLNRGCIPSKILIHSAEVAEIVKRSRAFGVNAQINNIDFRAVVNRASSFVDEEAANIEEGLGENDAIDLYKVRGNFLDAKTLQVSEATISGDRILVAAGTRPFVPPISGIDSVSYITSDEALRLDRQPKSMAIIGGGYIAAELGHFFGALGTDVALIERGDTLIGREDKDVAKIFTDAFSSKYRVLLNSVVTGVGQNEKAKTVTIKQKDGGTQTLEVDEILVTTGRRPNTDLLEIEKTGIVVNDRGFVVVNEFMETNVSNVFALGDVVGKAPFKHGANWEADHVSQNLSNTKKKAVDYSIMPHAIFSSPQVAGVGITEQMAIEKNINYVIRKKEYKKTGMGKALEEDRGFVKFVIDTDNNKILGCHILGPHASILIHEVVVAMTVANGSVDAIMNTVHIHPALSEVVRWAL